MRVLITGISGFVGSRLADCLSSRGHAVGGTFIEDEAPAVEAELYRADLGDLAALAEACGQFAPDRILHLAGLSHVGASFDRAELYRRVNLTGTENLVGAAGGTPVVLASSSEVYGVVPPEEQPIPESREPEPRSPYAESKAASERVVLEAGGLVVRCFNIVGPGQAPDFAFPAFARQLAEVERAERMPTLQVGNLQVWRDFVHLEDAIEGYALVLERGEPGEVYNLGTGVAHSVGELLHRLIAIAGLEVSIEVDPDKFRPVDAETLAADNRRIRGLGWKPGRELDDALRGLWERAREGA
jgi:GDP-4-dehydro-6-deoxy-D-mannose reductase